MNRRQPTSERRLPDCLPVLALTAALLLPALSHSAAPPPRIPEVPGPGPLFNPEEIQTDPLRMSVMALGSSTLPRVGPFSSLAGLYAGERTRAWSFDGPMSNRYNRVSSAAATLIGNGAGSAGGFPALSQLALLKEGEQQNCWLLIDTDQFRALPPEWLRVVSDGKGAPDGSIEAEMRAHVLVRAHYTSLSAFQKHSRRDITFGHLTQEPDAYRGKVVHVEGRLLRINRFNPPIEAAQAGISDVYTAWVGNAEIGSNPFCIEFTTWPQGLPRDLLGKPSLVKDTEPIRVSFDGFFFFTFPYKDVRGGARNTPLVIGHSLVVTEIGAAAPSSTSGWMYIILYSFLGILGGLICGVVALTYWYRRNDNLLRQRLMRRMPEFALPPPDVPPTAPPVAPPVKPANGHHSQAPPRPRITFPSATGDRGSSDEGKTPEQKDKPPDEGAGA